MKPEVMKPRSYLLENLAIFAALVAFAMWLGACGVDVVTPHVQTTYDCTAKCWGEDYYLNATGCAGDEQEAAEAYVEYIDEWLPTTGIKCAYSLETTSCVDTGRQCVTWE